MTWPHPRHPHGLEPALRPHRFGRSPRETIRVLDALVLANRRFGGTRSLLHPLRELVAGQCADRVRLLDIGCGRADIARALIRWARSRGLDLRVVGVDLDPEVIEQATAATVSFPEIALVRGDARHLPFARGSFDYVVSSLLLHYLSAGEAPGVLRAWAALASRAVVVSDRERHWFPGVAITVLGGIRRRRSLFGASSSGHRGFTTEEMVRLAARAGFATAHVERYFPFRLALVGWVRA
jgi:SAM-dependent methyltransferase